MLDLFDAHSVVYALAGLAALGGALLPRLIGHLPASPPMAFLALGLLVFSLPLGLGTIDPLERGGVTEYLTEIGVIVALMGAGLKLDRPFGWCTWQPTIRLLAITMPLTIALAALLGWWAVGLVPATAVLLGAVLAPTDPVLASDVQVGPPGGDPAEEDDLRFSLTSEAGLNDALAFPFTNAAIAMAIAGTDGSSWLLAWFGIDVVYKLAVGLVLGVLIGKLLSVIVFRTPENLRLASRGEGFVALAGTFLAYGVTEMFGGYGFLAVFVAAVVLVGAGRLHRGRLHRRARHHRHSRDPAARRPGRSSDSGGVTTPRTARVRAPELTGSRGWIGTGGKSLSISDFRGRILVLDFWTA